MSPTATTHQRRPGALVLVVAVLVALGGIWAPAASAWAGVGPETRVRAFDHLTAELVGRVDVGSSTGVGVSGLHLRRQASATGVATEGVLVPRQGSVNVLGKAKQTELSYAEELAGRGFDVEVRGTGAAGHDLVVSGVPYELKTLTSGSQTAVMGNVERGLAQGGGRVIIDGRAAGLSHGDALRALDRLAGKGSLNGAVEVVIETRSGRIVWP